MSTAYLKRGLSGVVFLRSVTNFSGIRYLSFLVKCSSKLMAKLSNYSTTYSFGVVFVVLPCKAEIICKIYLFPGLNLRAC